MTGNVKLMTSAGGGVVLDTATTTATDVTVKVPVTGVNNGTLVCSDSSGNVGIGTTSPSGRLNVANNSATVEARLSSTGNVYADLYLNTWALDRARIRAEGSNPGAGSGTGSGALSFWVAQNPTMTEAMRIDSSGNVLFCKSSSSATVVGSMAFPSGEFYSSLSNSTNVGNTTLNVYSIGASAYRFYVGMGGTVYATNTTISGISDQRYKENVRNLDDGLNAILALKPRKFDWKEGKGKDIKNDRGFIAQEFEQVFPDLIDEWKDPAPEGEEPYKSVRQDLIPVLVKAIQELSAKNDALEARIAALEAK